MSLPVLKRELLRQPGGVNVSEDRYGIPDQMKSNGYAKSQLNSGAAHPLQAVEEAHAFESLRQDLAMAKRIFGSQLSQQLSMEMQACAQVGRFQCTVPSSRVMLDTLMGTDDFITIDDVLKNEDHVEVMTDMSPMVGLKK